MACKLAVIFISVTMWGSNNHQKGAAITRHPSTLAPLNRGGGFLGGNKKWNQRPASWAAPANVNIFPPERNGHTPPQNGGVGRGFASVSSKVLHFDNVL